MAIPERRKLLLVRLAALIKNLERHPDNFTLDKQLDREISRIEKFYKHSAETNSYRAARRAVREEREAAAKEAEANAVEEEVDGLQEVEEEPARETKTK